MTVWYPPASKVQDFTDRFPGSKMEPNCLLLHSTEGTGWPGYRGGATAPHLTAMPDFTTATVKWRQHTPIDHSARALENRPGGVETNTLNVVQVEMVGTCDPATHREWERDGIEHIYMPEAPDWYLRDLADFVRWLDEVADGFHIRDGAPRGWGAYPDSYGIGSRYRMTANEWRNFYGICGHSHAPENAHGDPGAFDIARLVQLATGEAQPEQPTDPEPEPVDVLDPANYPDAKHPHQHTHGPQITWLGERLVAHGFDDHYTSGPGPNWSNADRANVRDFQHAQGWTGAGADGYPGPETLRRLEADVPRSTRITARYQNVAGYNAQNRPGVVNYEHNIPAIAREALASDPTPAVLLFVELSADEPDMRPLMDRCLKDDGYVRAPRGSDGRYIYPGPDCDVIDSGKFEAARDTLLTQKGDDGGKPDDKQAAWVAYTYGGIRAMDVSCHTEAASGSKADRKRVEQTLSFLKQAVAKAHDLDVPLRNVLIAGDFNSEHMVVNAMARHGWKQVGDGRDTFTGWKGHGAYKRLDWTFVLDDVKASGYTDGCKHSDHYALQITRTITEE